MPKSNRKGHDGPRSVPPHWRAPEVSSVPAVFSDNPADWPLGPAWSTRYDGIGSQALFLSRQRPAGNLSIFGATVNEKRGLTDTMGEHAVGTARLEKIAITLSGRHGRAYAVTPEYVAWRIRQGQEQTASTGEQAPAFPQWRSLLGGLDEAQGPDLVALETELHQTDLLDKTGALIFTYEFGDWWLAREENEAVDAFMTAAHDGLLLLDDGGVEAGAAPEESAPGVELLSETKTLRPPSWFTEEGTQLLDSLINDHAAPILDAMMAERFRQRLQHMAWLTQQAGQKQYSTLIATAAWGLNPESGQAATDSPFLRGILKLTALSAALGPLTEDGHDHDHDHDHHGHAHTNRQPVHRRRGRR